MRVRFMIAFLMLLTAFIGMTGCGNNCEYELHESGQLHWERCPIGKNKYEVRRFSPEGKLLVTCETLGEALHGPFVVFFANGDTSESRRYNRGDLDGQRVWYYASGGIKHEAEYSDSLLHGAYIGYHEGGEIARKVEFIEGMKHGEWFDYLDDGQLLQHLNFKDDKLEGLQKFYDNDSTYYEAQIQDGAIVRELGVKNQDTVFVTKNGEFIQTKHSDNVWSILFLSNKERLDREYVAWVEME